MIMEKEFIVYNTLTRRKEKFEPINSPHVGLYVCGPTVYGEPHLGHIRMAINFDVLHRHLNHLGYKVRFVRNVTDVGHLEDEVAGAGEDRITKKARLEQLEPMEIVQKYKNMFNDAFTKLNIIPPSIEPHASGHIIEQQVMIKKIIENGFAYEVNGSVYFDIEKYHEKYNYGKLSGRKVEDMLSNTRELEGQQEKRNPLDFALWKKATPEHIMRWPSEWSDGFPGWHLECSAMGTKYLGETFDIHGGGMDLIFPHHECEIAQSVGANGNEHVKYWVHNNMITINGQKMAKSLNNFITLRELFSGNHEKLEQAYSPMTIRFFVLQAHYRSQLDFSNESLKASEKGFQRLGQSLITLEKIKISESSTVNVAELQDKCYAAMNDDLNTPILIAHLFDGVKMINNLAQGNGSITAEDLDILKKLYNDFVINILGFDFNTEKVSADNNNESGLIELLLGIRQNAKIQKDFATADQIRDELGKLNIVIKDTKDGAEWEYKN